MVALGLLAVALLTQLSGACLAQDQERELEEIRTRIDALEARLAEQNSQRDLGMARLRDAELKLASATKTLAGTRAELAAQREIYQRLAAETAQTTTRLRSEQIVLAQQVRAGYTMGRQHALKVLLSQEDPSELARMMTYFSYFNRARSARIRDALAALAILSEQTRQTRAAASRLAELETAQVDDLATLDQARRERAAVVADIEAQLQESGNELEGLRQEEQRLGEFVANLSEILATFPVGSEEPFSSLRGRLAWPVEGRVISDYGSPRAVGQMVWNGVLIGAEAGVPVRAVYRGRVVFSGWLSGQGLLIIIDHGSGYLSLYGYNEVLTKELGDWVETGEVLARVGDTGGQTRPALYFELRRDGQTIDPRPWIARPQ